MVADPDVGPQVLQAVVPYDVIAVADQLQDEQVLAVRQDKGPFVARRGIVRPVQAIGVLVDDLVLDVLDVGFGQTVLAQEGVPHVRSDPDKVDVYVRGRDFQAR